MHETKYSPSVNSGFDSQALVRTVEAALVDAAPFAALPVLVGQVPYVDGADSYPRGGPAVIDGPELRRLIALDGEMG